MSSSLGSGSLSHLGHLGLSSGSSNSQPTTATYFYSFPWLSGLLSCLFPSLVLPPSFIPPCPLSLHMSLPPSLCLL